MCVIKEKKWNLPTKEMFANYKLNNKLIAFKNDNKSYHTIF